jgi:hypothetical protein
MLPGGEAGRSRGSRRSVPEMLGRQGARESVERRAFVESDEASMTPELTHCFRYVEVEGKLVDRGFDVMISGRTVESDAELIAWAEKREAELRRRRVA